MHHEPAGDRLLAHLRDRYGIDPVAATKVSVHNAYVFRVRVTDTANNTVIFVGSKQIAKESTRGGAGF